MNRRCFALLGILLGTANVGNATLADCYAPVAYPLKGSSAAWVYRFCSFTSPKEPITKVNTIEPALVNLDAPSPIKETPASGPLPQKTTDLSNFSPYLEYLQAQLKQSWHPPAIKKLEQGSFILAFEVSKNGEISHIHSSAFAATNDSLIKALKKISPLMPLPEGCPDIELNLMFDYVENYNSPQIVH